MTVNSTADSSDASPGDGVCDDGTGACTLRAAADESLALSFEFPCTGAHSTEITIAVSGTIVAASELYFGAGPCFRTVAVAGPGADQITVRGGGLVFGGHGAAGSVASLSGVSVIGAPVGIRYTGAGVGFGTSLTLDDVVMLDNERGMFVGFRGQVSGTRVVIAGSTNEAVLTDLPAIGLSLVDSEIRDNGGWGIGFGIMSTTLLRTTIRGNGGAGMRLFGVAAPRVSVLESLIDGNAGPGIDLDGFPPNTIARSTISNNREGGLRVFGPLTITDTTISGNETTSDGGGLSHLGGTLLISRSTITANRADGDGDGAGNGGGIAVVAGVSATIERSIVSGNSDADGDAPDCAGTITSSGYNLVGSVAGCELTALATDLIGADPLLGPLLADGVPTPVHPLLAGSPAIDAGGACSGDDQRGVSRPQGPACDIGAFEFACGNGQIDPAEQCDDGNTLSGDCCSPGCQQDAPGSPCEGDGEPCTLDACDGLGSCTHELPPAADCLEPVSRGATLAINDSSTDRSDTVTWTWMGLTGVGDFGNPTAESSLTLCVADAAGNLKLSATMPAAGTCAGKNCWRATKAGYSYTDPELTPSGIHSATLRASASGSGTIKIKGKGENLSPGELPLALPATVRLVRSDAPVCWESHFTTATRNEVSVFRAKAE